MMDDTTRMELIREALEKGGPAATEKQYEAVRAKVLKRKFSPQETLARADELAASNNALERAIFREWMRIQAAAEQGHRFENAPRTEKIVLGR